MVFERLVLVEDYLCVTIMYYYLIFCNYNAGTVPVKIALLALCIKFQHNYTPASRVKTWANMPVKENYCCQNVLL